MSLMIFFRMSARLGCLLIAPTISPTRRPPQPFRAIIALYKNIPLGHKTIFHRIYWYAVFPRTLAWHSFVSFVYRIASILLWPCACIARVCFGRGWIGWTLKISCLISSRSAKCACKNKNTIRKIYFCYSFSSQMNDNASACPAFRLLVAFRPLHHIIPIHT